MDIIYLITRISVFSAVGLIIYYMIKTVNNEQSEEAKDKTDLKTPIKIIVFPALAYYLSSVVCAVLLVIGTAFHFNVYDAICSCDYKYDSDEILITIQNDEGSDDPVISVTDKKDSITKQYRIKDKYSRDVFFLENLNGDDLPELMDARRFFGGRIEVKFYVLDYEIKHLRGKALFLNRIE